MKPMPRLLIFSAFFTLTLFACTLPDAGPANPPQAGTPEGTSPTTDANNPADADPAGDNLPTYPPLDVSRIAIRNDGGDAQFYVVNSGEPFVARGVNYVDFYLGGRGEYNDSFMATDVYDPQRVREGFSLLKSLGYTTVRIFFDTCGYGARCIGNISGQGLNPAYLDNMVDVMHIAGEEGIYIIFTANTVPESGGYWEYFDRQINSQDVRTGFSDYRNSDWLHPAGVEIKRRFWHDLMSGMVERDAPMQVVLGWQLTNEHWLFKLAPPLNMDEGLVTAANEHTYDMADPAQKQAMVVDNTLFYMEEIVAIIKSYDPQALTTIGYFAPQYPNPTGIGGDWYVDTAPMIGRAPIDFWDLHAYFDTDLGIYEQTENFGVLDFNDKPVIMGETAAGKAFVPSAASTLSAAVRWYQESCQLGWDGWLYWGFYPFPEAMAGDPWTPLEEDGLLLEALAPVNYPDPCGELPDLPIENVAYQREVRYSRQLQDEPASAVVDGGSIGWVSGDYPPQWVEVTLDEPTTVGQVGLVTLQWPPGDARLQLSARLADGSNVILAHHAAYTISDAPLTYTLNQPLNDVVAVRLTLLDGPAWAAAKELEVISAQPDAGGSSCLARAAGNAAILHEPRSDADTVGTLFAGGYAYIDSQYADEAGQTWLKLNGTGWLLAAPLSLGEPCADLPSFAGEPYDTVERVAVEFVVTAPPGDEPLFITGDFGEQSVYPLWNPLGVILNQQNRTTWHVTLQLPVGETIEYNYTRGWWDRIERNAGCGPVSSRFLEVTGEGIVVEDSVALWADTGGCN